MACTAGYNSAMIQSFLEPTKAVDVLVIANHERKHIFELLPFDTPIIFLRWLTTT